MKKNSQSLFIGLSFLVLGLTIGLLFAGQGGVLQANVVIQDEAEGGTELALEFVSVSVDDDAVLGDENAPITIVEFSDFECPYCVSFFRETFPRIQENYIDKGLVRFVYRDFPSRGHPESQLAAEAAECVGQEGGDDLYYAMHDKIFVNAEEWAYQENAEEVIIGYASELGVDIQSCLANGDQTTEVADDQVAGRSYGVEGTPTFYINGLMLVGAQPYAVFESIIESELQ